MLKNFIKVHSVENPMQVFMIRYRDIIQISSDKYGVHARLLLIDHESEEHKLKLFSCWESVDEIVKLIKNAEAEEES